jgi:hypothetical protein
MKFSEVVGQEKVKDNIRNMIITLNRVVDNSYQEAEMPK